MSFFYAVKKGHTPDIYNCWEDCQRQIAGYSGSEFKKFKTMEAATAFMEAATVFMEAATAFVQEPSVSDSVFASASAFASAFASASASASSSNPLESLSHEQQYAFHRYKQGHNLFITGPGGTGKSHLIKTIKDDLDANGVKHAVCALTGCAAVLLNCCAKTIHSWSGIGLGAGEIHDIVGKVIRNRKATTNWKTTRVLIVDEVSMLSMKIFDVLNKVGQTVRKNYSRPFGGIQLIFIGDFFQLPPVGRYTEPETTMFCFQSAAWLSTFSLENHIQLKTLYRQKDPRYIKVLEEVRQGVISPESVEILNQRTLVKPTITPTKLFPINSDAERVNQIMYMKIAEEEHVFTLKRKHGMRTFVEIGTPISPAVIQRCQELSKEDVEQQLDLFAEGCKLTPELQLKKGAFVMCLANLDVDAGICNGSQGVVVDFVPGLDIPIVRFLNGIQMRIVPKVYQHGDYPTFGLEQIPLRLAWAFTIHKSQGITLDIAEMDLGSNVFEYGQSYVGLSRVRNLEGLYLSNFNPRKIKTNPTVAEFYRSIPEVSDKDVVFKSEATTSEALKSEATTSDTKHVHDFTKFAYVDPSIKVVDPSIKVVDPSIKVVDPSIKVVDPSIKVVKL
jgi:ATP-dependent DNA helicase PIF1